MWFGAHDVARPHAARMHTPLHMLMNTALTLGPLPLRRPPPAYGQLVVVSRSWSSLYTRGAPMGHRMLIVEGRGFP